MILEWIMSFFKTDCNSAEEDNFVEPLFDCITQHIPAYLPQYETEASAGMDLKADIADNISIPPGQWAMIPTGISLTSYDGDQSNAVFICSRSGLAAKHGIFVLNAPGIVDMDYTFEIKVILANFTENPYVVAPGDRIAQAVIVKIGKAGAEEHYKNAVRTGGFGSTGTN